MWKTLVIRYNSIILTLKIEKQKLCTPNGKSTQQMDAAFRMKGNFSTIIVNWPNFKNQLKKTTTTLLLQLTTSLPGSWIFNETVFHLGEISTWSLWFWIHHVCGFRRFHTLLITFWAKSSAQNYFHKIMHFPQKIVWHWKGILFECNSKVNEVEKKNTKVLLFLYITEMILALLMVLICYYK